MGRCVYALRGVELDAGQLRIDRQLYRRRANTEAAFGRTQTKRGRNVDLGPETVTLLRTHRRTQNELKLRNRTTYHDLGLVFAREHRLPDKIGGEWATRSR